MSVQGVDKNRLRKVAHFENDHHICLFFSAKVERRDLNKQSTTVLRIKVKGNFVTTVK